MSSKGPSSSSRESSGDYREENPQAKAHSGDGGSLPVGPRDGPDDGDLSDSDETRIVAEIEGGILDIFGDAYCNKHLMYSALELILIRLMPELAEKGIISLWEERLS